MWWSRICPGYTADETEATGHTKGEAVIENSVDATCTTNGSYDEVVYCTVCNAEVSRKTVTIDATGHSYEAVVTEPTCTEGGYTTYTCSVCGDTYTADETEATGHSWDEGVVTKTATCTEDGEKTYTCKVCGETKTETIAATGHSLTHVEAEKATCTEDGNNEYWYCSECGKYYSDSSATTEISQSDTVVSTTGHSLTHVEAKAASSTENGNTEYWYCLECGKYYSDSSATTEIGQSDTVLSATGSTESTENSETMATENTSDNTTSPQTGDSTNLLFWIALMIIGGIGFLGVGVYFRRRKAN
ncbi:MAG: LPXTG cell wall anchor domain-containing protein [Clostridiales bacterium]|nr:LPXTG cell wall anchor domain-containing protein [Clostridiales bacterium]